MIDTELPNPAAAWLWAHAQVTTFSSDTDSIPDLIKQQPERALSRVIAPRYLRPSTSYLVCLVPTFDPTPDPSSASLGWAWQHSTPPAAVTLPVYYSWRFTTTNIEADFSTLVQQLKPWEQGGVGVRPMDISNAGAGMPSPAAGQPPWTIGLEGSLRQRRRRGSRSGAGVTPTVETTIEQALAARIDGTAGELSPPTYGATQASFQGQLAGGQGPLWLRTLNLDPALPRRRVARSRARAGKPGGADPVGVGSGRTGERREPRAPTGPAGTGARQPHVRKPHRRRWIIVPTARGRPPPPAHPGHAGPDRSPGDIDRDPSGGAAKATGNSEIPALMKLRAKSPPGLVEMTGLPGLGPKRARQLFDELGIDSPESLRTPPKSSGSASSRALGQRPRRASSPGSMPSAPRSTRRGRRASRPRRPRRRPPLLMPSPATRPRRRRSACRFAASLAPRALWRHG